MPQRAETPANRVRAMRETRGISQLSLAAAARITRQSLSAIETGRSLPAVDLALRIARALDVRVEELFGAPPAHETLSGAPLSAQTRGRVAVAHIAGRWVACELERDGARIAADALATTTATGAGALALEPLRSPDELRRNVIVMGCAMGLGLLADRLNSRAGEGRFRWLSASSTAALEALERGFAHVAGVHLTRGNSREPNVDEVRRVMAGKACVLITLARWEAGLLLPRGNPKRIRGVGDLGRRGLRIATRESGSGARALLERELKRAGLSVGLARSSMTQAAGHEDVARAIAMGAADSGVATRDVAIGYDLAFLPLAEERYDLVLSPEALADARIERLLDMLTSAVFRRELHAIGYDVRQSGDRVAASRS